LTRKVASGEKKKCKITVKNLEKFTGPPKLFRDQLLEDDMIGVATGMAWTPVGGDILFIETKLIPGKGKLILTGSLGKVMQESATAALSFLKSKSDELSIDKKVFEENDIHIHLPEGGIPKDGPSAGIALTTALTSAICNISVDRKVSMTGEITLRGRVLPVGGIKEKVLAAKRAGIKKIIMPYKNKKDLKDIKENYLSGIDFVFTKNIVNAVNEALTEKVFNE